MVRDLEACEKVKGDVGKCDAMRSVCWTAGLVFAILGVIGDAANVTLVLESISWLLLAVAALIASILPSINWAMAWYLMSVETKGKKKG